MADTLMLQSQLAIGKNGLEHSSGTEFCEAVHTIGAHPLHSLLLVAYPRPSTGAVVVRDRLLGLLICKALEAFRYFRLRSKRPDRLVQCHSGDTLCKTTDLVSLDQ